MPRALILLPTTSYRTADFVAAADRAGVEAILARDRCQKLAELWPDGTLAIEFHRPEEATDRIVGLAAEHPLDAILPTDEQTAVVAALAAERLGLRHNAPDAARATRDKAAMREILSRVGVPQPEFRLLEVASASRFAAELGYPCVLKPRHLSASRGVIRVDSPREFEGALRRLQRILAEPEIRARGGALVESCLCEDYVAGAEVAVEGLVTDGAYRTLAIFDKPAPLEGPFFEETYYVTPSRLSDEVQRAVSATTALAAAAIGLRHGPVHAELRVCNSRPMVIEVAARTIGGLCSRALRFGDSVTLEDLVLAHALGEDVSGLTLAAGASGVLMVPIPSAGVLQGVHGIEGARAVPGIEGVEITARLKDRLVPLPEGHQYLGFIFARGRSPERVIESLNAAHHCLRFDILTVI